jgi:hypothetical protein
MLRAFLLLGKHKRGGGWESNYEGIRPPSRLESNPSVKASTNSEEKIRERSEKSLVFKQRTDNPQQSLIVLT